MGPGGAQTRFTGGSGQHAVLLQVNRILGQVEAARVAKVARCRPCSKSGAMPPFGNLFGLDIYADDSLEKDKEIAFNAGTHRELIRMSWADFRRLAEPRIMRFAVGRSAEAA